MEYSTDELEKIKKKYELTQQELEEMYQKCKYVTFYNCTICNNPTAVFVGGQTGSGKGGIDVYSENEFLEKGISAALIDIDVYRALYPRADEILEKYPTIYSDITAKTTGKVVKQIIQDAIDNKYSFIFEGTLRNTEAFETMKKMPNYFNKIVRVMAVPKVESLLTAFERNDEQVNLSGYGRFTNVETHNVTFDGMLNTVKIIEQERPDITIEVFVRGESMTTPIKVFSSQEQKINASDEIIKYRNLYERKSLENAYKRLDVLLKNLRPKDQYEEEQLEKLQKEIKKYN